MMIEIIVFTVLFLMVASYIFKRSLTCCKWKPKRDVAVLITGCDTGIGYSLARYCQELGLTVLATCYNYGKGALDLEARKNIYVSQLDVSDSKSIKRTEKWVEEILDKEGMSLKAIVNNAAIMVSGEFPWLTDVLIQKQIQTNLLGPISVTRAFLPVLIRNKGRIINICSHCSFEGLPGISIYSATKAGLLSWNDSLRVEMKKFHVPVVSLFPGSYPFNTNILASQKNYADEMERCMPQFYKEIYGKNFELYHSYLTSFELPKDKIDKIPGESLYNMFNDALLTIVPKAQYCYSPWRYWIYFLLFKTTPTSMRDWLVVKFMNMPEWVLPES